MDRLAAFFALAAQEQDPRKAAVLDAAHKCGEAESVYRRMPAQGLPSAPLMNNLGNHYLMGGQPEKAQVYFSQLLKIDPAYPNANLQPARLAQRRRQALEYLDRVQESEACLARALAVIFSNNLAHRFAHEDLGFEEHTKLVVRLLLPDGEGLEEPLDALVPL